MQGKYEYKEMSAFPHMGPEDTLVWRRFLEQYKDQYDSVDYDTKVGFVPLFVTQDKDAVGGDIANLYLRKIDVVGFANEEINIIEVKPKAGFSTVGQILGYVALWKEKYKDARTIHAAIVTGEAPLDVRLLAEQNGVEVFVV